MSQMFVSKSWIWEVSTADPLSSSQAFLFVLPAYHSPKIFIAHLYQYRTGQPWDSIIQYFSSFHCAFWLTKRPVRSHVIYGVSWIGLLQKTITWYKTRHAGGQSRSGTLKQRPVTLDCLGSRFFEVPMRDRNNNELALHHGGFCTMWSFVAKGLLTGRLHVTRACIFKFICAARN